MNRAFKFVFLLAVVLLNGYVVESQSTHAPELKPGWKRIDAEGRFSFHIPASMQPQDVHGIDSYVGQYRNERMQVLFDYGMYSNSLETYSDSPEYKEINKSIGDLPAKMIFFRQTDSASGYKYFAAVYFASTEKGQNQTRNKLNMQAEFNDPNDWQTAQAIFESIRFK